MRAKLISAVLLALPLLVATAGGHAHGFVQSPSGYGAPAPPNAGRPQYAPPYARRPQPAPPVDPPPRMFYRAPGPHNGDWLRETMRLPPQEQQKRLEQDPHFRRLSPPQQQELLNRLQHFNSLDPEERRRILNRMEMIEHLPPAQQQQAHALFHQFRTMDQDRKELIRRTLRQMRGMPPDARERFLNSPLTQSHFSPQEMQMLRGFNAIGFVNSDQ
jgi:hypothetical protein